MLIVLNGFTKNVSLRFENILFKNVINILLINTIFNFVSLKGIFFVERIYDFLSQNSKLIKNKCWVKINLI